MILILDILTTTMVKISFFHWQHIVWGCCNGKSLQTYVIFVKNFNDIQNACWKGFSSFVRFLFPKWMWKKLFASLTWLEARNLSSYYRFYGSVRYNFFSCLTSHNLIPNTSVHTQQLASKKPAMCGIVSFNLFNRNNFHSLIFSPSELCFSFFFIHLPPTVFL